MSSEAPVPVVADADPHPPCRRCHHVHRVTRRDSGRCVTFDEACGECGCTAAGDDGYDRAVLIHALDDYRSEHDYLDDAGGDLYVLADLGSRSFHRDDYDACPIGSRAFHPAGTGLDTERRDGGDAGGVPGLVPGRRLRGVGLDRILGKRLPGLARHLGRELVGERGHVDSESGRPDRRGGADPGRPAGPVGMCSVVTKEIHQVGTSLTASGRRAVQWAVAS